MIFILQEVVQSSSGWFDLLSSAGSGYSKFFEGERFEWVNSSFYFLVQMASAFYTILEKVLMR